MILIDDAVIAIEIPTPGWGPRHPPGAPPRDGGWGRGIKHSKPRGTGDFSENPPGFSGDFLLNKWTIIS